MKYLKYSLLVISAGIFITSIICTSNCALKLQDKTNILPNNCYSCYEIENTDRKVFVLIEPIEYVIPDNLLKETISIQLVQLPKTKKRNDKLVNDDLMREVEMLPLLQNDISNKNSNENVYNNCDSNCEVCIRGRCLTMWKSEECGNSICESPRESSATCCKDCGCPGTFKCKLDGTKQLACLPEKF